MFKKKIKESKHLDFMIAKKLSNLNNIKSYDKRNVVSKV